MQSVQTFVEMSERINVRPCVRFDGMPTRWAARKWDYYSEQQLLPAATRKAEAARWQETVHAARVEVRSSSSFGWRVSGTKLASTDEVLKRYSGVIFIGDSQVREVAWAALRFLAAGRGLSYSTTRGAAPLDPPPPGVGTFLPLCHNKSAPINELGAGEGLSRKERFKLIYDLGSTCSPRGIGRYGFTASCDSIVCRIHSPREMRTQAEICAQIYRPHSEEARRLSISPSACDGGFFVAYHAQFGAVPIDPSSLPTCLRGKRMEHVLWVINGSPLHELCACSERRWNLPATVMGKMTAAMRERVVWQPGGAAFLKPTECTDETMVNISQTESRWLEQHSVRQYDYFSLALEYAPLMADGRHFTYHYLRCNETFPELAYVAARLALQAGLGRPVAVCPVDG